MMTTAFVLSGGGSLGAVQVGMLQALAERDIADDPVAVVALIEASTRRGLARIGPVDAASA
jgi:hypothetical protein